MKRRDVLRRISSGTLAAAGATMLPDALTTRLRAQERPASVKGLPPLKITDIQTILTAPNRIRLVVVKVVTSEPGLVGLRLRHLHPARPGGADGSRAVPQAVSHRAQRRRDRGHLAVLLRQLVLAQRRRPVQRDERRGHRAVGHQGQARQHAALPVAWRQGAARRRLLLPRQRPRLPGGGGQRAERHGGRIPARPRAGGRARVVDLRHAQHDRRRGGIWRT